MSKNMIQARWGLEELFEVDALFSRRMISDLRRDDRCRDEENPWSRCGLPDPQRADHLSKRLLHAVFFLSAWVAMPLAVLTIHGWVGLIVHGFALSGAAGLLQRTTIQTS